MNISLLDCAAGVDEKLCRVVREHDVVEGGTVTRRVYLKIVDNSFFTISLFEPIATTRCRWRRTTGSQVRAGSGSRTVFISASRHDSHRPLLVYESAARQRCHVREEPVVQSQASQHRNAALRQHTLYRDHRHADVDRCDKSTLRCA